MSITVRYLSRLFSNWAARASLILTVLTILFPNFLPSVELARIIAGIAYVIANVDLFTQQEHETARLKAKIDEYETKEAELFIHVLKPTVYPSNATPHPPFSDVKLEQYGYDKQGVPGWGVLWMNVEIENRGQEQGKLIFELERDKTVLPSMFAIDEKSTIEGLPDGLGARKTWSNSCNLNVRIVDRDPRTFAEGISFLPNYRVCATYYTKRIGGQSERQNLIIEGDFETFRQEVIKYWKGYGFDALATLANSKPLNSQSRISRFRKVLNRLLPHN